MILKNHFLLDTARTVARLKEMGDILSINSLRLKEVDSILFILSEED